MFTGNAYRKWYMRRKIHLLFGADGKHGSIVVIECFIRTIMTECT